MNKIFNFKYLTVFATHDETIAQKLYENDSDVVLFEGKFYSFNSISRERLESNLEGCKSSNLYLYERLDNFNSNHLFEIHELNLENIVYVSNISSMYAYESEQHGLCVRKFLKIY